MIEASMVLVLSAVVAAGVMVYYQTAQSNNQLEKTSEQIMHIVSEINGLYAGAKDDGSGIYDNLETSTILNAVQDQEAVNIQGDDVIKTAIPDVYLGIEPLNYDPVTKGPGKGFNNYFMMLTSDKAGAIKALCQRFTGLNFGGQAVAFSMTDDISTTQSLIDISQPFSDRLAACQKLSGSSNNMIGVLLK